MKNLPRNPVTKKDRGIVVTQNEFMTTIKLSYLLSGDIGINGDDATIIDTIYFSKKNITNSNMRKQVEALFCVQVDQDRIDNTIKRLIKENKVYRVGDTLLLTPQTMEAINSVIIKNEQTEQIALQEWINQYEKKIDSVLPQDIKESVEQCILNFIRTFFLTHGADCYVLLVGAKQISELNIDTIVSTCTSAVSPEYVDSLTCFLKGLFSYDMSEQQKSFLLSQLKKAVHYLSMVVDDGTKNALVRQLDQVTVYLDTTILYRLFNLQGEKRYESISSLISFCQKANVSIKVLSVTLEEMKRRINYDARIIINHPTPVSFASIGYKCRSSENYISTFWKEQSQNGVSARDFNFRYSNVFEIINDFEIDVDNTDYVTDYNLQEKKNAFQNKVIQFDSHDPEYQKSPNAINHDAECLSIIEHLQRQNAGSAIEAKTFFLSSDWSLIRLQKYDFEYKNKTDMVVLPSQLMQIFCMTSPTTDYYEAFLGLFSSSRTSFGTNALSNEQIQEILGRVAMYKGTTPSFAERVLANQLIQTTFSKKETEEEKTELIDNSMIIEVESMEEALETKEEAIQLKELIIDQVKSESLNKDSQISELFARVSSLEGEHNSIRQTLDSTDKKATSYRNHIDKLARRAGTIRANLRFVGGFILIPVGIMGLLICIAALLPITSSIVAPCLNWISSSSVFAGAKVDIIAILAVIVPLSLAAVSAGYFFIKPGYEKIRKDNYERYYKKSGLDQVV